MATEAPCSSPACIAGDDLLELAEGLYGKHGAWSMR